MALDIAAIKNRAEMASPAPWAWQDEKDSSAGLHNDGLMEWSGPGWVGDAHRFLTLYSAAGDELEEICTFPWGDRAIRAEDGDFITTAREDIPALVSEVERLRTVLDAIAKETMRISNRGNSAWRELLHAVVVKPACEALNGGE